MNSTFSTPKRWGKDATNDETYAHFGYEVKHEFGVGAGCWPNDGKTIMQNLRALPEILEQFSDPKKRIRVVFDYDPALSWNHLRWNVPLPLFLLPQTANRKGRRRSEVFERVPDHFRRGNGVVFKNWGDHERHSLKPLDGSLFLGRSKAAQIDNVSFCHKSTSFR